MHCNCKSLTFNLCWSSDNKASLAATETWSDSIRNLICNSLSSEIPLIPLEESELVLVISLAGIFVRSVCFNLDSPSWKKLCRLGCGISIAFQNYIPEQVNGQDSRFLPGIAFR